MSDHEFDRKVFPGASIRTRAGKRHGRRISTDALYGPESADVYRRFQREKGLKADVVVGPITWRATWQSPIT